MHRWDPFRVDMKSVDRPERLVRFLHMKRVR